MITGIGLHKKYDDLTVLENINFEVAEGEIYGLVGRSGAGKSTLLRCINGLESYQGGSLKVDGVEVGSLSKKELRHFRKNIGMIFQHFSLLERRTVYQNVALPMKCWKCDEKEKDKRVRELIELVGLTEKINDKPRTLSGGQKQRVAIARALTMNPKILLCDEATSALDPKTTKSILQLLRKINEELGITIIVVTHQMSVVREVCHKCSILENGHIAATGKVEDLFLNHPPALKRLLGTDETILPESGKNIKLYLPGDAEGITIIADIVKELGVSVSLVGGKMEKYRDRMFGDFIINVADNDMDAVVKFLEERSIANEILER